MERSVSEFKFSTNYPVSEQRSPVVPHPAVSWVSPKDTDAGLPSLTRSDLTEMDCELNIRIFSSFPGDSAVQQSLGAAASKPDTKAQQQQQQQPLGAGEKCRLLPPHRTPTRAYGIRICILTELQSFLRPLESEVSSALGIQGPSWENPASEPSTTRTLTSLCTHSASHPAFQRSS